MLMQRKLRFIKGSISVLWGPLSYKEQELECHVRSQTIAFCAHLNERNTSMAALSAKKEIM